MTVVPVLCNNCDTFFEADVLKGAILNNTLIGNNPIPCPFCGNTCYTIKGLYSVIGETLQIIIDSLSSKDALSAFSDKLNQLKSNRIDPTQFKNEVPELSKLKDSLPKTRSELYAFIAVLLTAISMLISSYTLFFSSNQSLSKEIIEQIVKDSIQKNIDEAASQNRKSKGRKN